jgi:transcriptional regulator with XRE-family HTH domain
MTTPAAQPARRGPVPKEREGLRPELVLLGERLRALRTERGVSVVDLAKATGLSHSQISEYEHGLKEPGITKIVAISKFFGVDIQMIIA